MSAVMADVRVLITMGEEQFTLSHLSVHEMAKVKSWTGYKNRKTWFHELTQEDPDALLAAYVLVKQRRGEDVRIADVEKTDFDLDTLKAKYIDENGREVDPVVEKNRNGTIKTDKDGDPIPVLDSAGNPQWTYTDTGEPVPTEAA